MVIKNQAAIEEKIKDTSENMKGAINVGDGSGTFSYWLGYLRALEWVLVQEEKEND
jgi:hypothetical protein